MARVFILEDTQKRNIVLDNAADFGELIFIFDGKSNRPGIWSDDFRSEIIKRFNERRFDPEKDYFCIVGYFVPVVIAVSELIVEYGEFKALLYSATSQHYLPRRLGSKYDNEITSVSTEDSELSQGSTLGTSRD